MQAMKTFHNGPPRSGLGATISQLKGRRAPRPTGNAAEAEMRRRPFAPNPGALEMLLHAPETLAKGAPLVVVLHGCTQGAAAFAADSGWLTLADRLGFAVLAPQQVAANNPNRCFNWFQPQDMRRDDGEPASIAAMIAAAVSEYGLDANRVYVTGLSAGGAMTAVMLAAYPDLFAGGAVIAGPPYGTARGMAQAFQTMHGLGASDSNVLGGLLADAGAGSAPLPPLSIWHGDADHVVNVANADALARQWAAGQGLNAGPDERSVRAGVTRAVWRDRSGTVRIELNQVSGLGHGVPLETRGPAPLGRTAPFMLQAGVNSTLEIARFWGLADPGAVAAPGHTVAGSAASEASEPPETPSERLGAQVMAAVAGVPTQVQSVIADALTRAGLMR